MKLAICLSELYFKTDNKYISQSVSYNFFKEIEEIEKLFLAPIGNDYKTIPSSQNSVIKKEEFIELPFFDSIQSFALKYYFNKKFKKEVEDIFIKAIRDSDVIWARNPSLASIVFSEIALNHNKKLLSHICADIESTWQTIKYKGIKKLLAYLMSKFILYKLKKITKHKNTYTLCTGSKLFNQFKPLNQNTKLFVDSLIKNENLKIKEKLDNSFVYVGRLNIEKGILDLIEACKILKDKSIDFRLDIIGFGTLEAKIKELIKDYKLDSNIDFIGSLPYAEVQKYYEKNSIFIMPSYREGFPRVMLEAWSYGMPVITTDVGGIKGLGQDRKNLLFVERENPISIANGMEELIVNDDLKNEMQKYIKENRETITFEYQKKIILEIIEKYKKN